MHLFDSTLKIPLKSCGVLDSISFASIPAAENPRRILSHRRRATVLVRH
jgi:hypothetical protein